MTARITMLCAGALLAAWTAPALAAAPAPGNAERTVRIATEGGHAPFNFIDGMGHLQGFEIDLANAVCAEIKATCEFVRQDFVGLIPALIAGKYDLVFSSLSMTDQRRGAIAFSEKYYDTAVMFVANKRDGGMDTSPQGMKGRTIGTKIGSANARYLQEIYVPAGAIVRPYVTHDEARIELANGRIDALIGDKTAVLYWMEKSTQGACCQAVGHDLHEPKYFGDGIGAGMRKADVELKAAVDKALREIRRTGAYDRIRAKYFPYDVY